MQYSIVALAALAASASAHYSNETTPVYTTEVVTSYTTYCPGPTEITHGGMTYTVTEATTLTITDCPCTIVKPVTTSSVVYCNTCAPTNPPVYTNATTMAPTTTEGSVGTTVIPTSSPTTTPIEANSGNKAIAFSGASLAGLLGLAAYIL